MLWPNHVLYLSCINANKFCSDLNALFNTSVVLIPCINNQTTTFFCTLKVFVGDCNLFVNIVSWWCVLIWYRVASLDVAAVFGVLTTHVVDCRHWVWGSSDCVVPPTGHKTGQGARTARGLLPTEPAQPHESHGHHLCLRHSHILPGAHRQLA